jgi:short-subunit dehydrogenase
MASREFAVVTGASTGIGYELARCALEDGCDVMICAEEAEIDAAAHRLRNGGGDVEPVRADLGTAHGVQALWDAIGGRGIDVLCANAGVGLGDAFLDQDWPAIENMLHVNVTGATALLHRTIRSMRARGSGRILITGSVAGFMPGSHQAVYNATKAYLDTLSWALREEVKDDPVSVTCLMPGPTETEFFDRAGMLDTPVGESAKADPAKVARSGWEAMRKGATGATPGLMNKLQTAMAGVIPDKALAKLHRMMAEPKH